MATAPKLMQSEALSRLQASPKDADLSPTDCLSRLFVTALHAQT